LSLPTHRDWFGLDGFQPGSHFTHPAAECYLLDEVGSTSDFLLGRGDPANGRRCRWRDWGWEAEAVTRHLPPKDSLAGTLVVARKQTGGRGRQGRTWLDCGGLFLSWIWKVDLTALRSGLAVWVGLIAAEALAAEYQIDIKLKWPNDLLIAGRKLGGILLDRSGPEPAGRIVAGLGLNLRGKRNDFPSELRGRATSLQEHLPRQPTLAEVAGLILRRLGNELPSFLAAGWATYRRSYARRDWLAGRRVTLPAGQGEVPGFVAGIDEKGALLVVTASGITHTLQAGDVHLTEPRVGDMRITVNIPTMLSRGGAKRGQAGTPGFTATVQSEKDSRPERG